MDQYDLYDVVAINAASMSTRARPDPVPGPIGATPMARVEGQWESAFPTNAELAGHLDMVVAGRVLPDGDDRDDQVGGESHATRDRTDRGRGSGSHRGGLRPAAWRRPKPAICRELCRAQEEAAAVGRQAGRGVPALPDYTDDLYKAVVAHARDQVAETVDRQQAEAGRGARPDPGRGLGGAAEQFEGRKGDRRRLPALTKAEDTRPVLRDRVRAIDGRGPRDIRPLAAEVNVPRACTVGDVRTVKTQILGVTTLNMLRMEQAIDTLSPERTKAVSTPPTTSRRNSPVGDPVGRLSETAGDRPREIAERALIPVSPSREEVSPTRCGRSVRRSGSERVDVNGSCVPRPCRCCGGCAPRSRRPSPGIAMGLNL